MKNILVLFGSILLMLSCNTDNTSLEMSGENEKSKPVANISDESIFNLSSKWRTEENDEIELSNLKGKVLVMVMIYTTCKVACPRLVADMKNIELQVSEETNTNIQYVLVSIDPKNDTPEKLKAFAIEKEMDGDEWTFLHGNEETVREFANVLAVKYKEISPMDFSHSNIISVFNPMGELVHQQEGLGVDNKETVKIIIETAKQ
ncbi:MAG: SCO family protein [Bacteroidetes bacterium]|nr:SCO family protein [Bacteroidota bacterium]